MWWSINSHGVEYQFTCGGASIHMWWSINSHVVDEGLGRVQRPWVPDPLVNRVLKGCRPSETVLIFFIINNK